MANLFIGFPVPRARIADMITGAAPPLEHVENHEPDGTDPIVLPGDITTDELLQWNGTKFIGAAAAGNGITLNPISIHPSQFIPADDQTDYKCDQCSLRRRSDLTNGYFFAHLLLPDGATLTKLTLYAYRDDDDAELLIRLYRVTGAGMDQLMAEYEAGWDSGDSSGYTESITYPTIDNATYSYVIYLSIGPNDDIDDVILTRVLIDFS